jgi:hypothetical protein
MKFLASSILLLACFSITVSSFACEKREAQIIANVSFSEKISMSSCVAKIKIEDVRVFNAHISCPLDLGEVIQGGIEVGFKDGHACRFEAGDEISGIVYVDQAGKVVLE